MKSKSLMCFAVIAFAIPALALKQDPEYRQARHEGAEAKFELRVVDDDDVPVEGATVKVFMGMNYREKGYWLAGETNTNGVWVLQGKTCGNEIEIGITKDGYYDSNRKMSLATMGAEHEVKDGKWQPWGKEERIVLRKIKNQVQPITHGGPHDIPKTNEWVSFDMQEHDWVAPFGKGREVDVEFLFSWSGKDPLSWEKQRFGIRFPGNPYNGGYLCGTEKESVFPFAFHAATESAGYRRELFHDMDRGSHRFGMLDGTGDFIFRIRSVTNSVGKLQSCKYGRFRLLDYGVERTGMGSMMMRYDYNPSSMDNNLEFKK